MTIIPVPHEKFRFWVTSESRDMAHLVDLDWREEKWHRPRAVCSCEACQAQGIRYCKHIVFLVDHLKGNL